MKLMEFFGKPIDVHKELSKKRDEQDNGDELFWYIIDHDKLHKDFFHPVAKKIHVALKDNKLSKEEVVDSFMPMVKKGCMEFYHHKELKERPHKLFTKEIMEDLCERLFDHYREDLIKGVYKLGQ
jgi:spermidine synthase